MRRNLFALPLVTLLACASAPVARPVAAAAPSNAPVPLLQSQPATAEPTQLVPLQQVSALELPGGDRVLAGTFAAALADGLSDGTNPLKAVMRLAPDGSARWVSKPGSGCDVISLAAAPDGSIFIAGVFSGTADLGDGVQHIATGYRAFVARLDGESGKARWFWSDSAWQGSWSQVSRIGVDSAGDVLAAGWFQHVVDLGGGILRSPAGSEGFAARLSGKDGKLVWGALMPGGSSGVVGAVGVPGGDSLFVAYEGRGGAPIGVRHEHPQGMVLARFSPEGKPRWVRRTAGTALIFPNVAIADGKGGAWMNGFVLGRATLGKTAITGDLRGPELPFVLRIDGRGAATWVATLPAGINLAPELAALGDSLAIGGSTNAAQKLGTFALPARTDGSGKPVASAFLALMDAHGQFSQVTPLPQAVSVDALAPAAGRVDALAMVVSPPQVQPSHRGLRVLRWDGHSSEPLAFAVQGPARWVVKVPQLKALWTAHRFVCPSGHSELLTGSGVSCRDSRTGQLDGPTWSWNADGTAREQGQNRQGLRAGRWRSWNPTTPVFIDSDFVDGKLRAMVTWWRPGVAQRIVTWDAQSRLTGIDAQFDADGHLSTITRHARGGDAQKKGFAPDGSVLSSQTRLLDGTFQTRQSWPNGKPSQEGKLQADYRRTGDWTFWYPDGSKACQARYADGSAVSATQYLRDGKVLGSVVLARGTEVSHTGSPILIPKADPCQ